MPTWAIILTVTFSGIVAAISIINLFRSATKDSIDRLERRIEDIERRLENKMEGISQRIDRHLEGHS